MKGQLHMAYVYIESERWTDDDGSLQILYTVGHYRPDGGWRPESDHGSTEEAAERVAWLNGGRFATDSSNWESIADVLAKQVQEAATEITRLDPHVKQTGWDGGQALKR